MQTSPLGGPVCRQRSRPDISEESHSSSRGIHETSILLIYRRAKMFRTNSKPDLNGMAGTIGAIIVVLKVLFQVYSFIRSLPKNQIDRVAILEARLARIELDLEVTKPMPPVIPTL